MTLRRRWWVGIALGVGLGAAAVAACGGGDDNASPGNDAGGGSDATSGTDSQAGDSSSPQDAGFDASAEIAACEAFTDRICTKLAKCDFSGAYPVEAACKAQKSSCPNSIFGDGSQFTPDQANACAAQMDELPCFMLVGMIEGYGAVPPLALFAACDVPGTRGPGDSCEFSSQCASLYCTSPEANFQSALNGGTAQCGSCAPTFGPNDNCNVASPPLYAGGAVCPPGTFCDQGITNRCVPTGPGNNCAGAGCTYPAICVANPDGGVTRQCVSAVPIGGACNGTVPCVAGAYCDTTCKPLPKDGEDCTSGRQCAGESYCEDLDAGPKFYCVPPQKEGESCSVVGCEFALDCTNPIVGQSTCTARQKNGDPCGTIHQKYPDGGTAPSTWVPNCASGTCSTDCTFLKDGGPAGMCIGGPAGGGIGEACGDLACTTCQGGSTCSAGKCATAAVDCH